MPLTKKGNKIMEHMKDTYGSKKAPHVFYASRNAGRISGVDPESAKPGADKHAHRRLQHQRRAMEDHMRSQEDALMDSEPDPEDTDATEESGDMYKSRKRGKLNRTARDSRGEY